MLKKFFTLTICLSLWGLCSANDTQPTVPERCPESAINILTPDFKPDTIASMATCLRNKYDAPEIVYALGDPTELQALLSAGANPNACAFGASILEISTATGNLEEVKMLLAAGAHPDLPEDSDGSTPLIAAIFHKHFNVAQFLLRHGANPSHISTDGTTPLFLLAMHNINPDSEESLLRLQLAKQLIQAGAPVNAQLHTYNVTPLMFAVLHNNVPLVELLLENGADVNLANFKGNTALTFAQKKGYAEIIAMLTKAQNSMPKNQ